MLELAPRRIKRKTDLVTISAMSISKKDREISIPTILNRKSSNWNRALSTLDALYKILPGVESFHKKYLFQPTALPLKVDQILLENQGKEQIVFKTVLKNKKTVAIKTNFLSRIHPSFNHAIRVKYEYETIKNLYKDMSGFVITEHHFLSHTKGGIKKQNDVLVTLQPYIDPPHNGLFEDYSVKEILDLANKHPSFRDELCKFINITLENLSINKFMPDIVGDRNVLVLENSDSPKLLFIDPHVLFDTTKIEQSPSAQQRIITLETLQKHLRENLKTFSI